MKGDYKELIDLSIFYLERKTDDTFKFKSAGPVHKAKSHNIVFNSSKTKLLCYKIGSTNCHTANIFKWRTGISCRA